MVPPNRPFHASQRFGNAQGLCYGWNVSKIHEHCISGDQFGHAPARRLAYNSPFGLGRLGIPEYRALPSAIPPRYAGPSTACGTEICQPLQATIALLQVLGTASIAVIFYLFPNGRFVPVWTRQFSIALAAPLAILVGASLNLDLIWFTAILGAVALGMYAQIVRDRRVSGPAERQQTKWVVFGFGLFLFGIFAFGFLPLLFPAIISPSIAPVASVTDVLTNELLRVVGETMQPESLSIWFKEE